MGIIMVIFLIGTYVISLIIVLFKAIRAFNRGIWVEGILYSIIAFVPIINILATDDI